MQSKLYNQEGKEAGMITLPERVFGVKWNADLVNQVVLSLQSNKRAGTAHAKTRGEVSGGGKKPWKQKGTGRARHGSTRSPIWRHGGVTHGPRNDKDYARMVSKKMKAKALYSILSAKLRDGELLFVDRMSLNDTKTKQAHVVVKQLALVPGFEKMLYRGSNKRALLAFPDHNPALYKSFRNLATVATDEARNLNPVDVLAHKYLVLVDPAKSLSQLEAKMK